MLQVTDYQRQLLRAHQERLRRLDKGPPPPVIEPEPTPEPAPEQVSEPPWPLPPPKPPSKVYLAFRVRKVIEAVNAVHDSNAAELAWTERRLRRNVFVRLRYMAMMLCRELVPTISLPQIGVRLGGFDHTTVLHGFRKAKQLEQTDATFADRLSRARQLLGITILKGGDNGLV